MATTANHEPRVATPQARFTMDGVEYVIVRSEIYDRLKHILESDHDELRQLLARSATENGWDDPGMEAYDSFPVKP